MQHGIQSNFNKSLCPFYIGCLSVTCTVAHHEKSCAVGASHFRHHDREENTYMVGREWGRQCEPILQKRGFQVGGPLGKRGAPRSSGRQDFHTGYSLGILILFIGYLIDYYAYKRSTHQW